jgi:hypothetical protein
VHDKEGIKGAKKFGPNKIDKILAYFFSSLRRRGKLAPVTWDLVNTPNFDLQPQSNQQWKVINSRTHRNMREYDPSRLICL